MKCFVKNSNGRNLTTTNENSRKPFPCKIELPCEERFFKVRNNLKLLMIVL